MRNALMNMCVAFAINGAICFIVGLVGLVKNPGDRFFQAFLLWSCMVFLELGLIGFRIVYFDMKNDHKHLKNENDSTTTDQ